MSLSLQVLRRCASIIAREKSTIFANKGQLTRISSAVIIPRRAYSHPQTHSEEDLRSLTKQEWEKRLTPEQFTVCREQCTEPPFSGMYNNHYDPGTYNCICCGTEVFTSEEKYDSGTGWPSFYDSYQTKDGSNIIERPENNAELSTFRTEVICKKCDSHLGHVFDDGPEPTGKRYCINSLALKFAPKKE